MKACLTAAVLVCALALGNPASAQRQNRALARQLFASGNSLFTQRQYREAIVRFKQAFRHWNQYNIQFNIALCYYNLGDKVGAVTHLRRYLKKATAKERKSIPKPLLAMQRKVAVIIVQVPDPKATIWVNGKLAGTKRVELVVKPGRRTVVIKKGEKTVVRKVMDLSGGSQQVWEMSKMPVPRPVVPEPPVPQPPKPPPRRLGRLHWGYFAAAAGLTVALGGVLTGLGVKVLQIEKDWKASALGSQERADLADKGEKYKNATNALVGVTAAVGVTAVVLAIFTRWRSPERESGIKIQPAVGPGGASFTVRFDY